jgi:hypothetical protein
VLSFVGADSFLELRLADVTPRTNRVADYFDVELDHSAERRPEHAISGMGPEPRRDLGI